MLRSPWSPPAIVLVLLMAVGSVIMWIGVPLGLIYIASQLASSSNPTVGPYVLVLVGLPVGWRSSASASASSTARTPA
jgi:hypothetical protein